ncbi:MAG: hypothetical protein Q8L79_17715 [Methylobacter sp.]|uniref:hypothetical protein n=1 Tax=Methylobacter sp. TaxID=2051955 RepID=UPI0027322707|nr:hypothetical protein [Methylobacter sp.]MDP1666950.1 hypothetical protein [Methylobacter sp.]
MSDSEPQSEPVVGQARWKSEDWFYYKKYLFGFFGLRRGFYNRNSQEQAERVALVTPLVGGDDLR